MELEMSLISQIRKYTFPRRNAPRVPLQYISDYDLRHATSDQLMMIEAGYARSPIEAQAMLDEHGMTARDLLPTLPPRRKRKNPLSQLANILMSIEGARRGGDIRPPKRVSRVWIDYKFKDMP
jgi:hypothetical protein